MAHNFKVRNTKDEDYLEMLDWWKWHKFPPPEYDFLPDNKSDGLMVSYEGVNLCSGFIYSTSSSKVFWIEFIVSNYVTKDRDIRKEGLNFLINGLVYMAKKMGAKYIYTSVLHPSLIKRFEDCGFIVGSKNASEMIKIIT